MGFVSQLSHLEEGDFIQTWNDEEPDLLITRMNLVGVGNLPRREPSDMIDCEYVYLDGSAPINFRRLGNDPIEWIFRRVKIIIRDGEIVAYYGSDGENLPLWMFKSKGVT